MQHITTVDIINYSCIHAIIILLHSLFHNGSSIFVNVSLLLYFPS